MEIPMRKNRLITILALLCMMNAAFAASNPVIVIRGMANNMVSALEKNKNRLKQPGVISKIVNANLVPYVDLSRMGASVVGRRYWLGATSAQRGQFIRQFKQLVISTYSAALSSYDDDKVDVYPLRGRVGRAATIKSVIIRRTGQRIPISYNVMSRGGSWKIYDFSIENVSMVRSYNAQFSGVLANGGMAALIQKLKTHNSDS